MNTNPWQERKNNTQKPQVHYADCTSLNGPCTNKQSMLRGKKMQRFKRGQCSKGQGIITVGFLRQDFI